MDSAWVVLYNHASLSQSPLKGLDSARVMHEVHFQVKSDFRNKCSLEGAYIKLLQMLL